MLGGGDLEGRSGLITSCIDCVLRATTNKGRQRFWGKECTPEKILATPMCRSANTDDCTLMRYYVECDFPLWCTKKRLSAGLRPDLLRELKALPQIFHWIRGKEPKQKRNVRVATGTSRRHLHSAARGDLQLLACRRSTFGPRSFAACATKLWNSLPLSHSVAG